MGVYNVYDYYAVQNAERNYDNIYNSAPTYRDSAATKNARAQADKYATAYKNAINSGYDNKYGTQAAGLTNEYLNNKFSWSADTSAEYQNAANRARREGARAQENTQASYAMNTGGYGNSYAQAAGQKAYNAYMDNLAEKIPTLKEQARQSWSQQQEQTLNQIGLLNNMDSMQYQRYRDKISDNYDFMTYYENKYNTERGLDMTAFQSELSKWNARLSAAQSNLNTTRQLAEQQYEHNSVSADTQASIAQSRAQTEAYYDFLRNNK